MKKIILSLLLVAFVSACSTRISGLTVISDRNVNTKNVEIESLPQTKNVSGKSTKFVFLFIPFGIPTMKEALENALVKGDGDMMIDASLYYNYWWFIVGMNELEFRGTVVKTRGAK